MLFRVVSASCVSILLSSLVLQKFSVVSLNRYSNAVSLHNFRNGHDTQVWSLDDNHISFGYFLFLILFLVSFLDIFFSRIIFQLRVVVSPHNVLGIRYFHCVYVCVLKVHLLQFERRVYSEKSERGQRGLPSSGPLQKWPQKPQLCQTRTRCQELPPGLPAEWEVQGFEPSSAVFQVCKQGVGS